MSINTYKLLSKKNLTSDVFEMVFEAESDFFVTPGQFITFLLPKTGSGRAYSILDKHGKSVYFLIKKLNDGRGGSKEICDLEIGSVLKGVGPAGHFADSGKKNSKLFIGTGTGLAPLYFIIKSLLESGFGESIKLILGNREEKDLCYLDKLGYFKSKYPNFDFEVFLSRFSSSSYNYGRVTSFLTEDNVKNFGEFYICGNPYMVDDCVSILKSFGISDERIFKEKY